jgi:hypothetical protein
MQSERQSEMQLKVVLPTHIPIKTTAFKVIAEAEKAI